MGSPDPRQVDGIGGAHPLTSKVAIVSRSTSPDCDIDFLFCQVGIDKPMVDTTPNCGNILAGVGPLAIERGLMVPAGAAHRAAMAKQLADPEAPFEKFALSTEERDLIRARDWRGLIRYGAIFFMLEKLGAVVGVSNLHIYAAMRCQTLEEFQKTRNAPGALYSVAGRGAPTTGWDGTRPR